MKNKIKIDQVKYVAELARIKVTEKQAEILSRQLNDILEYIDKLDELNTKDIEPMSHALNIVNIFRDDKVKESLEKKAALQNAPSAKDGFFQVPRVI